jgi:hypothetical protein
VRHVTAHVESRVLALATYLNVEAYAIQFAATTRSRELITSAGCPGDVGNLSTAITGADVAVPEMAPTPPANFGRRRDYGAIGRAALRLALRVRGILNAGYSIADRNAAGVSFILFAYRCRALKHAKDEYSRNDFGHNARRSMQKRQALANTTLGIAP